MLCDTLLRSIIEDLRSKLPLNAMAPDEQTYIPPGEKVCCLFVHASEMHRKRVRLNNHRRYQVTLAKMTMMRLEALVDS